MAGRLKPLDVERVTKPGKYADGGGLYLIVTGPTSKSWSPLLQTGLTKALDDLQFPALVLMLARVITVTSYSNPPRHMLSTQRAGTSRPAKIG